MQKDGKYVPEGFLFIFLLVIMYKYYNELKLIPLTILASGIAFSVHILGRFGLFSQQIFGLNYDVYAHFCSTFALTLFLYFFLKDKIVWDNKSTPAIYVIMILLIGLGFSAIGEFIEFTGELTVKDGEGFLGLEADHSPNPKFSDQYWDTITDLLHNGMGGIASLMVILFIPKKYYPTKVQKIET